jgi:N-acetylglucosaminyl-diphospho-decaprenol L-rhamnosyltransferase
MTTPLLPYALVVVSFDSSPELRTFFHSLDNSDRRPAEVVIVENGPALPRFDTPQDTPIHVVHRPDNPGYGAAVNAGVSALNSDAPWILISNPDVALEPDTVEKLLAAASGERRIGSVGPALLNPDGTVYPSAREIPRIGIGIGHALFGAIWKTNPWTKAYRGHYGGSIPRECGWLSGAFVLVNREAFDRIGGFDTGYFMFMEDVDLGMRLGEAGFRNLYVPSARATHIVGHATASAQGPMAKAHHDSAKRFLRQRYPGVRYVPARLVLGVGLTVRQWLVQAFRGSRT